MKIFVLEHIFSWSMTFSVAIITTIATAATTTTRSTATLAMVLVLLSMFACFLRLIFKKLEFEVLPVLHDKDISNCGTYMIAKAASE